MMCLPTESMVGLDIPVADGTDEHTDLMNMPLDKHSLLSLIETRLTDEVRRGAADLRRLAAAVEEIRKGVPADADFVELVLSSFELLALQLSNTFLANCKSGIFLDDGREYLRQLGLSLQDAIREIHLDGRDYVCIVKVGSGSSNLSDAVDARDGTSNERNKVHV